MPVYTYAEAMTELSSVTTLEQLAAGAIKTD